MDDRQFKAAINRICNNDREGLRLIYEEYNPMIFSVIMEILHNQSDGEDVTSEFFIRLWNSAYTYRSGHGHRAWLISIAHNMAIDHLRKHSREDLTAEIPETLQQTLGSSEDLLCSKLSLEDALKILTEEERQIINLKIMGDLTFQEISRILKKPLGTVSWRYRQAIEKLKRCSYE